MSELVEKLLSSLEYRNAGSSKHGELLSPEEQNQIKELEKQIKAKRQNISEYKQKIYEYKREIEKINLTISF